MSATLVIETTPFTVKSALVAGERLQDLHIEDATDKAFSNRMIWARVDRIDPRLDAAFLDVGSNVPAFLTGKDARFLAPGSGTDAAIRKKSRRPEGIREFLREGEFILVQGQRDATSDKGPKVTTDLTFLGENLVYRPNRHGIELARAVVKTIDPDATGRLEKLLAENDLPTAGWLVKSRIDLLDEKALIGELSKLAGQYRNLRQAIEGRRSKPGLLPAVDSIHERLARRYQDEQVTEIVLDDASGKTVFAKLFPNAQIRISLAEPSFKAAAIDHDFESLVSPVVELQSGNRLVFQQTLVGTVIDVDGSKGSPIEINREAAREIARQIRLRNLGGTILIDFIDLGRAQDRKILETGLRQACSRDRLPLQIYPMTPLGIVQISRAKRSLALSEWMGKSCTACSGMGLKISDLRYAERLFQKLRSLKQPPRTLRLSPSLNRFIADNHPEFIKQSLAASSPIEKLDREGFDIAV